MLASMKKTSESGTLTSGSGHDLRDSRHVSGISAVDSGLRAHTMSDPVFHDCKYSQCQQARPTSHRAVRESHMLTVHKNSPEVLWYPVWSPSTHTLFQTIQLSKPWPSPRASPSALFTHPRCWPSVNSPDFACTVIHLPLQVAGFKTSHQFIRSQVGTCFLSLVLSDLLQVYRVRR